MTFTVIWTPQCRRYLADLWLQGPDRQALADSADRIDQELRNDADQKGIPLGSFRQLNDDPLSVLYFVDHGDCKVHVFQLRRNK